MKYFEEKELVTKGDLQQAIHKLELKIANLRHSLLKSIIWTGATLFVSLGGMMGGMFAMMAHGFHWI